MAVPSLTRNLDDDFVNTWYEIRSEVVDNILDATILTLALREFGCMVPQVGGEYITRTPGYGEKSSQRFDKGTTLEQSVPELDTLAMWNWRYFLVDINRSWVDDHKNEGPFEIKDYLMRRLEAARNALVQDLEAWLFQWGDYYTAPYQPNGLYDICPNYTAEDAVGAGSASDSQAVGTSNGGIDRATNTWWRNWVSYNGGSYSKANKIIGDTTEPFSLNLLPDLRHAFNTVRANKEAPNFILCDQEIYEVYEDDVSDRQQIVRSAFSRLAADLGFDVFTFKGATMSYSEELASTKHLFMLNMNHIEFVYNPNAWFDFIDWMRTPNQLERVAYIACMTSGMITDEPRRHGVMEYAS